MRLSVSYFEFIRLYFGVITVSYLKQWINTNVNIIKLNCRISFLNQCIQNGVVPSHLNCFNNMLPVVWHWRSFNRLNFHIKRFQIATMRTEIIDARRMIYSQNMKLAIITRNIAKHLPVNLFNFFYKGQQKSLNRIFLRERHRLEKKFTFLFREKNRVDIDSLTSIEYFAGLKRDTYVNRRTGLRSLSNVPPKTPFFFSSSPVSELNNTAVLPIIINAEDFKTRSPESPLDDHKKWLINLSSYTLPNPVKNLLQLGAGFCIPLYKNREMLSANFIKNIENNLRFLPINERQSVRNRCLPWVEKVAFANITVSKLEGQLLATYKKTSQFLKQNDNIVFTKADKGNITVALDKSDYIEKMRILLDDEETYTKLQSDPASKLTRDLKILISRWKTLSYITNAQYRSVLVTDGVTPVAYGLPKVHKTACPLRIIVSSIGSPLYLLAKFLHKIIFKSVPVAQSHINNSFALVSKLSGLRLDEHLDVLSLDVVSLFTNVPLDLALLSIKKRWDYISKTCKIPLNEFLSAIKFVLNSTYFKFNNTYYKQTFGTPMGSPLSPIIADLVLQDLESKAIKQLPFHIPIYFRYVDDILLTAQSSMTRIILDTFNSFHPRLQFTCEVGHDKSINFLDINLKIVDGVIECNWYQKPTASGRYLNYFSCQPLRYKLGMIIGLCDRAFLLSHPKYHRQNFYKLIDILLKNGYPLTLIFKTLKMRLSKLILKEQCSYIFDKHSNAVTDEIKDKERFFVIPYIHNISENLSYNLKDMNLSTAFLSVGKLSRFVKPLKDKTLKDCQSGVVYRINCHDCDASYVGQTSRQLKTRVKEHRNQLAHYHTNPSVISEHRLTGHEFDWDSVEILDREKSYVKRCFSEMFFIKRQKNAINLCEDVEGLSSNYTPIIERLLHT